MYARYFRERVNGIVDEAYLLLDKLVDDSNKDELASACDVIAEMEIQYRVMRYAYELAKKFDIHESYRRSMDALAKKEPRAIPYIPVVDEGTLLVKPDYVDYTDIVNRLLSICYKVATSFEAVEPLRHECHLMLNHCDRSPRLYEITWSDLGLRSVIKCTWDGESESYILTLDIIHDGKRDVVATVIHMNCMCWYSDGYKYTICARYKPHLNEVGFTAHASLIAGEKTHWNVITKRITGRAV